MQVKFRVFGRQYQVLGDVSGMDTNEAMAAAVKAYGMEAHHVEELPQSELAEAVEELKEEAAPKKSGRFSV